MPTKWLQERTNGSKNEPGMPPHRGLRGTHKSDLSDHPWGKVDIFRMQKLTNPDFLLLPGRQLKNMVGAAPAFEGAREGFALEIDAVRPRS